MAKEIQHQQIRALGRHAMQKYLILMPWGRVGSNLVMNYLKQAISEYGKLGNQLLTGVRSVKEQYARLDHFYNVDSVNMAVTKESLLAMVEPKTIENYLFENDIHLIKMTRRSILKTAISQIRAEEFAKFTYEQTGKAKWGVEKSEEPLPPIHIPLDKLKPLCALLARQNQLLDSIYTKRSFLEIVYEDLLSNMPIELKKLSEFMQFKPVEFSPRFRKATQDEWQLSVSNHDEILSWVPAKYIQ